MLTKKTVITSSGDFTIAPLTLRQAEQSFPTEGQGVTIAQLILISLKNAGYEGDEDSLKDVLSIRSLKELANAVIDLSGLQATSGEASAAETPGTSSTAA